MGLYDVVEIDDPKIRRMLGRYAEEEYQTKYVLEHGYIRVGTAVALDETPPEISKYDVEWYREVRYIDLFLRPKQDVSEKKPLLSRVKLSELGDVYRVVAGVWVCVEKRGGAKTLERVLDNGVRVFTYMQVSPMLVCAEKRVELGVGVDVERELDTVAGEVRGTIMDVLEKHRTQHG